VGITIHYRGKLPKQHSIDDVIGHFKKFCFERDLECWVAEDEVTNENCLQESDIGTQVKGIKIDVHSDCEILAFTFDVETRKLCDIWEQQRTGKKFTCGKDWEYLSSTGKQVKVRGSLFCKTQFAGVEAHLLVCALLEELKNKFIPSLYVSDEAGYWKTRDMNKLKENFGVSERALKALGEVLKAAAEKRGMEVETGYDQASKRKLSHN